MTDAPGSMFGDPLPIHLEGIRAALDVLDPETRLEAVSAAMPVYLRLQSLQQRLRNHVGLAVITVVGFLREGRFAFAFELNERTLTFVDLVIETPPPDEPDGALSFIVYLNGIPRVHTSGIPSRKTSSVGAAEDAAPVTSVTADEPGRGLLDEPVPSPESAITAHSTASGRIPSRNRAAFTRALADLLTLARAALAIIGMVDRSPRPARLPSRRHELLADRLAATQRALAHVRGALSTATVLAAERLAHRRARPATAAVVRIRVDQLLAPLPSGARPSRPVRLTSPCRIERDELVARVAVNDARMMLGEALADFAVGGWHEEDDGRRDFGSTIADLVATCQQAFGWSEPEPEPAGGPTAEVGIFESAGEEAYMLMIERPTSDGSRPAFFVDGSAGGADGARGNGVGAA